MTMKIDSTHNVTFPQYIEKFFSEGKIIIKTFPDALISIKEPECLNIKITSAQQYIDYLETEIAFWKENDPKNKLESFTGFSLLTSAKNSFENAVKSVSSYNTYFKSSVESLSKGTLYSQSHLAKILINHIDKPSYFFDGFRYSLLSPPSGNITTATGIEGYLEGREYRNKQKQYADISCKQKEEYIENLSNANNSYSELNLKYTTSIRELEQEINNLQKKINTTLTEAESRKDAFFTETTSRREELENLYQEKLKLQAPAEYWREMKQHYFWKGIAWITISLVIAVSIIIFLMNTILSNNTVFVTGDNWIVNVKNSAILTVITSICIYALRTTVKMSLSSLHLSRDAKERENLSYFYLALIEKGAVTEKERAIVLNSLFSRSDTGLLKGDSSPTMSGNINDLLDIFKNNSK